MSPTPHTFQFKALGGINEIQFYYQLESEAQEIAEKIIFEVQEIEKKFSRYQPDSIISVINKNAGIAAVEVDQETAALIDYAAECWRQSEGLFDISSGILRQVWDFKNKRVPQEAELEKILPLIGWEKVNWNNPHIFLTAPGMEIDFGGIGKEFAVDKLSGLMHGLGLESALINLGGDVRVLGPQPDGSSWNVGVQHPRKTHETIAGIFIAKGAIATSGDYERSFELNGKRYSHILNPKNGMPVESFQSVTVISESCLVSGSLATLAMLKGEEKGLDFLNKCGKDYICIDSKSNVIRKNH